MPPGSLLPPNLRAATGSLVHATFIFSSYHFYPILSNDVIHVKELQDTSSGKHLHKPKFWAAFSTEFSEDPGQTFAVFYPIKQWIPILTDFWEKPQKLSNKCCCSGKTRVSDLSVELWIVIGCSHEKRWVCRRATMDHKRLVVFHLSKPHRVYSPKNCLVLPEIRSAKQLTYWWTCLRKRKIRRWIEYIKMKLPWRKVHPMARRPRPYSRILASPFPKFAPATHSQASWTRMPLLLSTGAPHEYCGHCYVHWVQCTLLWMQ